MNVHTPPSRTPKKTAQGAKLSNGNKAVQGRKLAVKVTGDNKTPKRSTHVPKNKADGPEVWDLLTRFQLLSLNATPVRTSYPLRMVVVYYHRRFIMKKKKAKLLLLIELLIVVRTYVPTERGTTKRKWAREG
jgi:hypothetical protein